jgi:hypothetical protein
MIVLGTGWLNELGSWITRQDAKTQMQIKLELHHIFQPKLGSNT